ncbi:MAG: threonylcarbamoyl-AMP synthase [Candidatus Aenigmarchaeota archaeon]|nr:threonylcarbamoyl-AMP synthase [Candidatus Aenigmarchaeota archaeon]
MKSIILNAKKKSSLKEATAILKKGGIIIYPTETSYGIGADFSNEDAKEKIYDIKERDRDKPLSGIVSRVAMIKRYAKITHETQLLCKQFMPGPLTLVVPTNGAGTIAFRVPGHGFARKLSAALKRPITATSANVSGNEPLYSISGVMEAFDGKVDAIVDAGNLPKRRPSTIYDVENDKLLREGPITLEQIHSLISLNISTKNASINQSGSKLSGVSNTRRT